MIQVNKKERSLKILLAPRISEKASNLKTLGQYVFKVSSDANKFEVAKAVSSLFNVQVESVRICNVMGKKRRFGNIAGQRKNWKKAYVSLKEGYSINLEVA